MTDSQKKAVIEGRHAEHLAKLQLKHLTNWEQVLERENAERAARKAQKDGDRRGEIELADHENEQYDKGAFDEWGKPKDRKAAYEEWQRQAEPGDYPERDVAARHDFLGGGKAAERRNKFNVKPPKEDPKADARRDAVNDESLLNQAYVKKYGGVTQAQNSGVPSEYAID